MQKYQTKVSIGDISFSNDKLPVIIAGPCVIESEEHVLKMAEILQSIVRTEGFEFVFKASFDKANRSSIHSYRGPGIEEGLKILQKVKREFNCPVITDIHNTQQIAPVAEIVDIIQIPAFLCRQTDLFIEAGRCNIAVNVKKGQFMSPDSMKNVIVKAQESGIEKLLLTERGTSFGYERLVVDFCGVASMQKFGVPLIFDATHSVQLPGAGGDHTAGMREFVPQLCRAAFAVGVGGLFLEVHDQPDCAPCDGPNMITPQSLKRLLCECHRIFDARISSHE